MSARTFLCQRSVDFELMTTAVCVRSLGNTILDNVCTMEKQTLQDAKSISPENAKAAIAAGMHTCTLSS